MVAYEATAGRIAAEMIAPAPPGVRRLVPGQRATVAHAGWPVANRDAGAFVIDPVDPTEAAIRVVQGQGCNRIAISNLTPHATR